MLDWEKYIIIADRFQHKARFQDREDLKHNIIVRLAEVAQRNGHKPLTEPTMVRVASFVVLEYWHTEKRNGKVISLNTETEDGEGNTVELIDTIADDKAIDLEAWVDARTWLLGCPKRLIEVARKRVKGIPLEGKEQDYLDHWRRKSQRRLF